MKCQTGRGGDGGAETPTYACRHNLIYWRNDDYLGIGPGAHSHLHGTRPQGGARCAERGLEGAAGEQRWGNRKPVPSYIKRVQAGDPVEEFTEEIAPRLAMGETMMLGLRLLREGVPRHRFAARHGRAVDDVFSAELRQLAERNLLAWDEHRVRLTPEGLLLGNRVFAAFLPD